MFTNSSWYKIPIKYIMIIGLLGTLTQVGGCTGPGIDESQAFGPFYSGFWDGTTNQGLSLAFTVEEIAATYDITSMAFTFEVLGPGCRETFLQVTENGIVEPIKNAESSILLESSTYSIDIVFYFDLANSAHGTWSVDYHSDSCDFIGDGTFTTNKGQGLCSDRDRDGYYNNCGQKDCRSNDADIHPGATEVCDDTIDNDCDGFYDCDDPDCFGTQICCPNPTDADSDGFVAEAGCGTAQDCNDNDKSISPGAPEVCDDIADNDCDGLINCNDPDCSGDLACQNCSDLDADDYFAGAGCPQASDCDDYVYTVNPGATEICNNMIDDNCDGFIDEGCSNNTLNVRGDYGTIQSAINAALHGDTVLVENGIYRENILFSGSSKTITVTSQNGAGETEIQGTGIGSVVTFAAGNSSTLSGFTVTNGSTSENGGGVLCGSSSSPTIENCVITGNTAAVGGGGIYCESSSSPFITNSIIQNNSLTVTNNKSNGGGILASTFSSPIITNCIIRDNKAQWRGGGLALNTTDEPMIVNCTFNNNTAALNGGAISLQDTAPIITNCTFSNNSASGHGGGIASSDQQPGTAVTNCILWGNKDGGGGTAEIAVNGSLVFDVTYSDIRGGYYGTGNINSDPLFVGRNDYHLKAGSPCIDTGTGAGAPSTDIDGDSRPQGAGFDMGSDEYLVP